MLSISTIITMAKALLFIIISIFLFFTLSENNKSKKNILTFFTILMIVGYWLNAVSFFVDFKNL